VNVNDHAPMTELQVTTCIFGSTYAFHRIAEGLNGVPFLWKFFVRFAILPLQDFEVTHPIFSKTLRIDCSTYPVRMCS